MKTDELTITGLLFSGIVLAGMWLQSHHLMQIGLVVILSIVNLSQELYQQNGEINETIKNN